MGYDLTRFIGVIDEEFLCSICTLVLENPLQSLCEHMFCDLCIKDWLSLDERCPDDRTSLTLDQLSAPGRIVRNLLNKLNIKCDFYREGCTKIVMLEYLRDHSARCEFNPNANIECAKGYNIQHELKQRSILSDRKYNLRAEPKRFNRKMMDQQKTSKIPDATIFTTTSKWQALCNLKLSTDQDAQVLEVEGQSFHAFAQSTRVLEPTSPHFKIKVMNFDYFKYMAVGFSSRGHLTDQVPGLHEQSVGYDSTGDLIANNISKKVGMEWKVGDVIECGIQYPNNFLHNQHVDVKLYFKRNEQLVAETKVLMPAGGYFPTVYMFEGVLGSWWENGTVETMSGTSTKVKFYE